MSCLICLLLRYDLYNIAALSASSSPAHTASLLALARTGGGGGRRDRDQGLDRGVGEAVWPRNIGTIGADPAAALTTLQAAQLLANRLAQRSVCSCCIAEAPGPCSGGGACALGMDHERGVVGGGGTKSTRQYASNTAAHHDYAQQLASGAPWSPAHGAPLSPSSLSEQDSEEEAARLHCRDHALVLWQYFKAAGLNVLPAVEPVDRPTAIANLARAPPADNLPLQHAQRYRDHDVWVRCMFGPCDWAQRPRLEPSFTDVYELPAQPQLQQA